MAMSQVRVPARTARARAIKRGGRRARRCTLVRSSFARFSLSLSKTRRRRADAACDGARHDEIAFNRRRRRQTNTVVTRRSPRRRVGNEGRQLRIGSRQQPSVRSTRSARTRAEGGRGRPGVVLGVECAYRCSSGGAPGMVHCRRRTQHALSQRRASAACVRGRAERGPIEWRVARACGAAPQQRGGTAPQTRTDAQNRRALESSRRAFNQVRHTSKMTRCRGEAISDTTPLYIHPGAA
jgi:hypothetical protein